MNAGTEMPTIAMQEWAATVLKRTGLQPVDACTVADNLMFAESRGIITHGLLRLSTYVDRIAAGGINSTPRVTVVTDLKALTVLDADHAPGASSGVFAVDLVIERAQKYGLACAIVRNANHFGASGYFTNRIADAGLVGMALCNTEPVMCAPAGGRPVLGTNPIAVAVPIEWSTRPQLDMATTTVSQGKLIMAQQAGEPIPLGWAVDLMGRDTISAADGIRGALLPSGGPKGFGLAFVVDALLALGGANVSTDVAPLNGDASQPQRLGHFFLAIRADATGSLDDYRQRITALVDAIHGSGTSHTSAPPLAPGEPELARARGANGVLEVSQHTLREMSELAAKWGVPLPSPAGTAPSAVPPAP
jgi:LDH2 family malate/lactate/ureidoglycolate dehydrogenase